MLHDVILNAWEERKDNYIRIKIRMWERTTETLADEHAQRGITQGYCRGEYQPMYQRTGGDEPLRYGLSAEGCRRYQWLR